jgi:hypothetical protein
MILNFRAPIITQPQAFFTNAVRYAAPVQIGDQAPPPVPVVKALPTIVVSLNAALWKDLSAV